VRDALAGVVTRQILVRERRPAVGHGARRSADDGAQVERRHVAAAADEVQCQRRARPQREVEVGRRAAGQKHRRRGDEPHLRRDRRERRSRLGGRGWRGRGWLRVAPQRVERDRDQQRRGGEDEQQVEPL
jgi:hypothetical protein